MPFRLRYLAHDLERSSGPFYGLLGVALRWRLEEDADVLALEAT